MAEPLKNLIHPGMVEAMAEAFARTMPDFPVEKFRAAVLPTLEECELMQRALLIAAAMDLCLPADFERSATILRACLPQAGRPGLSGWALLPFNHYVSRHGLASFDTSLDLLKALTPHFTAEFGIRAFIHQDQERALAIISGWTDDPNHHVRRLASEGTRPRLPWAMRLPHLIRDPQPILPLLARLMDDPEDYVRRSVANSLNDIAKDHPDLVADFVEHHRAGASKERQWLLKHASRTLIKKGHTKALANFGYHELDGVTAELHVPETAVSFPGQLDFQIILTNSSGATHSLMLDYAIHHQKKDGSLSPKVFKGKSLTLASGQTIRLERHHAFRPITTRVYYPGLHSLEILVNGKSLAKVEFILEALGMEKTG